MTATLLWMDLSRWTQEKQSLLEVSLVLYVQVCVFLLNTLLCMDRKASDSINFTSCGCSSGACYDYGPSVRGSVLRWH